MIKSPFRPCDYCGRGDGTRKKQRTARWTIHLHTRKISCPRCRALGIAEDEQALSVLRQYGPLLRYRITAEPVGPYASINPLQPVMEPNRFGANLKKLREHKGLSQQAFASLIGVNRSTYSEWERGASQPALQHLAKLQEVHALGVDVMLGTSLRSYTAEDLAQLIGRFPPRPRINKPAPHA